MENIFNDAYFGKLYKTRDGRKVLYHSYNNIYPDNPYEHHHNLILEKPYEDSLWIYCNDYGHTEEHINGEWLNVTNSDIVSEWGEPFNEAVEVALKKKSRVMIDKVKEWFNKNWRRYICQDADGVIRFSGWKRDFEYDMLKEKELEKLDYELARDYCIANEIEDDKKDVACVAFQAGRCSGWDECEEDYTNCVVVHLDKATDEERDEIAHSLAEWLNDNYPHLAREFGNWNLLEE